MLFVKKIINVILIKFLMIFYLIFNEVNSYHGCICGL